MNSNGDGATRARETGTLGKLMVLLDLVTHADAPLRFTDILALAGQPRGTLHRQLSHLVEEGLIELDGDGRYSPGLRLLDFAARSWARNEFRLIAEPHLADLQRATGETVHLGVLRGQSIIYLDKVEGRQPVRMYSQIGNASPCYCTGVGKAALSLLPAEGLVDLVAGLSFTSFTASTHVSAETLLAEIREIADQGYAFDREEHEAGICCVAAPVWSEDRTFMGAFRLPARPIDCRWNFCTNGPFRFSWRLGGSWRACASVSVRAAEGKIAIGPLLDAIAEHAYDERDIEICRRITTTRTVREIYNQSPAERSTLKPIPPAIVVPPCNRNTHSGQVSQTVCRQLCRR